MVQLVKQSCELPLTWLLFSLFFDKLYYQCLTSADIINLSIKNNYPENKIFCL